MQKEQEKLQEIYNKLLPSVSEVGVFPNIQESSKHNPYLSLLYKDFPLSVTSVHPLLPLYLFSSKKTVIHYNWLECKDLRGVIILLIKLLPLLLFIAIGGKVVWTVHNRAPHHGKCPQINRVIRSFFARRCSQLIVHSEASKEIVSQMFSVDKTKIEVVPHPTYPVTLLKKDEASNVLSDLLPETKGPVFLMYGYILPYKGIVEVVKACHSKGLTLIVAGKVKDELYFKRIKEEAQGRSNIILIPRFITDREEEALFSVADAAIFNFQTILTSGSIVLAHSYQTPIISKNCKSAVPEEFEVIPFETMDEFVTVIEDFCAKIS